MIFLKLVYFRGYYVFYAKSIFIIINIIIIFSLNLLNVGYVTLVNSDNIKKKLNFQDNLMHTFTLFTALLTFLGLYFKFLQMFLVQAVI